VKLYEDENYRMAGEGVLVRRGVEDLLRRVDSVIFDIDGVLIDVRGSFRVVICRTVDFYFRKVLGVGGDGSLLHIEDTHHFKMAGGFNNDWDLTEAAIAFFVWKHLSGGLDTIEGLSSEGTSVRDFTEEVGRRGGGLDKAYEILSEWSPELMMELRERVKRPLIRRIFQELYSGGRYCRRLYGFDPEFNPGRGAVDDERHILDPSLLDFGAFSYAILSGRTPEEAELALELLGIDGMIPRDLILADDGRSPKKPDPWGLFQLVERLKSRYGVYVGDTIDDLLTVSNYNARGGHPPVVFCYCMTGTLGEGPIDILKGEGVPVMAEDINCFLRYISSLKGEHRRRLEER